MSQSSTKVFDYLSDLGGNKFTENAPRPPVPGEENEQQSTHSSGSQKSHMSMKSQSSGKSGGSQNNGELSQSATPRRSNLDKTVTGGSLSCSVQGLDKCDDDNAPLGFEPEGSVANSPPFTENSTPPCLKWASGLHHLLEDSDGVQLFSKFLEHEGGGKNSLDFFFACQGLKKQPPSEKVKINHIIKVIHKKFIRGDTLSCISVRTRRAISDHMDSKNLRQSIFNDAQSEVEDYMKKTPYRLFLNSDFYVQYVERAGKSSETSSGSNSVRPLSGPLPTLMEDQEMPSQSFEASMLMGPPSSRFTSFTQPESKGARRTETISGYVPYTIRQSPSHPYYTSYAPVSAVDSEIQSLSSDALTDDTISLTDSSVDGYRDGYPSSKKWKHQRRAVHRRAQQNREGKDAAPFIPRTDRPPKDRNIAETDPPKFAALLIEKLESIQQEKVKEEKMEESLRMCESEDGERDETMMKPSNSALLLMQSIEEDNPQSILEDHCSRIWDESSHHTPSRSPPKSKSPDRTLRKSLPASSGVNTTFPGTLISKSQRKGKKENNNYASVLSFDSGVGPEEKLVVHHHHHHHHGSRAVMEWSAVNRSMSCWRSEGPRGPTDLSQGMKGSSGGSGMVGAGGDEARRKDGGRRSNGRKMSTDASSVFDSGISGIYEKEPSLPAPNPTDPNYEKVLHWMLASDNSMSTTTGTAADSDRTTSSSNKWSHKVASSSPSPQPHKAGCSKKQPSLSASNRSASAERGGAVPSRLPHGAVLPGQPFVQDPSMPILTPPNVTTQLEEAKRRLESEAQQEARSVPVKSKSFAGVSTRDKRSMPPPMQTSSQSRSNTLSSTRTVPVGLDLQSANMTLPSLSSSEKKSCKKSSTPVAMNTSAMACLPSQSHSHSQPTSMSQSMEDTVIGIYFCGDPIPYRHTIPGTNITLAQFKQLITKRGNYRFYFKKNSDEFGSGAVFEEVNEDGLILPLWEGKIVAKVERLD